MDWNYQWRRVVIHELVDADGTLRGTVTDTRAQPGGFGPWKWEILEYKPAYSGGKIGPADTLARGKWTVEEAVRSIDEAINDL